MTELLDLHIGSLKRLLALLDTELVPLNEAIVSSVDPDGEGLCDHGEYLIGVGLVATQQYIDETFRQFDGVNQTKALQVGPKLLDSRFFAESVHAAANYWKHGAEWWKEGIDVGAPDSIGMREVRVNWPEVSPFPRQRNIETLKQFGQFGRDYLCSNVLAAVSAGQDFGLKSILPPLIEWRNCLVDI